MGACAKWNCNAGSSLVKWRGRNPKFWGDRSVGEDLSYATCSSTSQLYLPKVLMVAVIYEKWKSCPTLPWNSPGQNTGVGSLSLLQGSSQPRDWTQVSCIAGRRFTLWDTREAHELVILKLFSMYSRIGQISKYIMGQAFSLLEREGRGSRSVVSDSLWPHGLQPTRLLLPWDFPDKSTGVGCHCLLQLEKGVINMERTLE